MCLWCVVDVFVVQLSVPPVVAQTVGGLCGSTVCATIGGTDSWIAKTSLIQAVAILCGPSVLPLSVAQTVEAQTLQQLSLVAERCRVKEPWQLIAWITTAAEVIGSLNTMDKVASLIPRAAE